MSSWCGPGLAARLLLLERRSEVVIYVYSPGLAARLLLLEHMLHTLHQQRRSGFGREASSARTENRSNPPRRRPGLAARLLLLERWSGAAQPVRWSGFGREASSARTAQIITCALDLSGFGREASSARTDPAQPFVLQGLFLYPTA